MKRTVLAILIAAVLALVGCAAVLLYVRGADARAVAGKQAVRVLIASKRIPAGTTGAELKQSGYTELVMMPKSAVPPDALGSIDSSLDELALNADLRPRQLLLRGAFEQPTVSGSGLRIPEGRIGVTVPIVNNAGPLLLQPGAKIAVYDTFTMLEGRNRVPDGAGLDRDHGYSQATMLLLPSVDVLAVVLPGQTPETNASLAQTATDEAKKALGVDGNGTTVANEDNKVTLVTVAVTPEEAERLVHAAQIGALYVALLDGSTTPQVGPGVDNNSLFN